MKLGIKSLKILCNALGYMDSILRGTHGNIFTRILSHSMHDSGSKCIWWAISSD